MLYSLGLHTIQFLRFVALFRQRWMPRMVSAHPALVKYSLVKLL